MKKSNVVIIVVAAIVLIIAFFGTLLYLGGKSSSFGLTEADKDIVNQYLVEKYNNQFEIVDYNTFSTGSGQNLKVTYTIDNREYILHIDRDRKIYYDSFEKND